MSGIAAIVPAAGAGSRVGRRQNKLFLPLAGKPLLAHALEALQASPAVRWIVLAVRPEDRARAQTLLRYRGIAKALPLASGGRSRAESVARGFAAIPPQADWVLIHDGARPCLTPALVARAVRGAKRHGSAVCGLPAFLTVKAADEDRQVRVTLDRDQLWFVQTPQVFRYHWFGEAVARTGFGRGGNGHAARALGQFPDDAALVEAAGFTVRMVPGDPLNIKVTTREDLMLAEAILRSRRVQEVKNQKARVSTRRPAVSDSFDF